MDPRTAWITYDDEQSRLAASATGTWQTSRRLSSDGASPNNPEPRNT